MDSAFGNEIFEAFNPSKLWQRGCSEPIQTSSDSRSVFKRALSYQVGIFRHDGDNAGTGQRTLAARFTGTPLRLVAAPHWLKGLRTGFAIAHSELPEGLNGLRGRTLARETFFSRVFVNGRRLRLGAELDWSSGPFSVKGEFLQSSDTRRGQGVRRQDLPNLMARGWYLCGTWS